MVGSDSVAVVVAYGRERAASVLSVLLLLLRGACRCRSSRAAAALRV
mgnify:FL=1|jgi:hypothetical protein